MCRRVHITLVGREAAPVYNAVAALSPDYIVYIYSDSLDSTNALVALKNEIKTPSEEHVYPVTNPQEIKDLTVSLAEKFKKDSVTVNITSGLKSWAYWFSIVFEKQENASVVYIDQNNFLWDYKTMQVVENENFDMHTFFRLYGNSIDNNYTDFADYTDKDHIVAKEIENIRKFNIKEFNCIATVLSKPYEQLLKNAKNGTFESPNGSYVNWEKTSSPGDNGRVTVCLVKNNGNRLEKALVSPHVIDLFFSSGWFEFKVAAILSKWPCAKAIYMNCRFPFNPNMDKNEVDILVNTGTKVLFVECKTQINNTVDIDKFRSVIKKYGGMGSKGLFITDAVMTDFAVQKCDDNALLHFSLQQPSLIPIEQALYMLLDSELYNINAR